MSTVTIGSACVQTAQYAQVEVDGIPLAGIRFNIDIMTVGAVDLAGLMDAIADKVPSTWKRVYPYPPAKINPPCVIVGYPDGDIEFDLTMQRGSDRLTIPTWFLVGKPVERATREMLSSILTGATGIKDAIDGELTKESS